MTELWFRYPFEKS